jgi:hypothetical protein
MAKYTKEYAERLCREIREIEDALKVTRGTIESASPDTEWFTDICAKLEKALALLHTALAGFCQMDH